MTKCLAPALEFPRCQRRRVQAEFNGGAISSDGGVVLLRQVDRRLGLLAAVDRVLPDPRDPRLIEHRQLNLLRQRVYGLCLGYEDLNDHTTLRIDPALQTAVERTEVLASPATLCRLEHRADRQTMWRIHEVLVEQFIASFQTPPTELVLDFDATDDPVHGRQEGRFFHGYYDSYCFLPLYVFCGDQLLVSYLRSSDRDGARHAWAILALLVKRLRRAWPTVRIIFRGDSGFCRWRLLAWCERHAVEYIVGIAKNARLNRLAEPYFHQAAQVVAETGQPHRHFAEVEYAADSWDRPRRILVKAEQTLQGANPRYVVTTLPGDPQSLYETLYCSRGEMENRIKEQQLALFADRTSCHDWWANQFRLLLASLAYSLMEALRRLALPGTELAQACVGTLRLKLLKIGAVIVRNTRRICFHLSSAYPYQPLFQHVVAQLEFG